MVRFRPPLVKFQTTSFGKLPARRQYLGFLGTMAQFERETIKERTHGQRLIRWQRGEIFVGELPYGYRWNKELKKVEHNPPEVNTYRRIVTSFLDLNISLTKLAVTLTEDHAPTRNKKNRWFTGSLSQILSYKDPHCTGKKPTKHFTYDCEPLISPSRWEQLQQKLEDRRTRSGRPAQVRDEFLLHKLLTCGICGSKLVAHHLSIPRRSTGEYLRRYTCWNHKATPSKLAGHERCPLPPITADELEDKVLHSLHQLFLGDEYFDSNPNREIKERELQSEIDRFKAERRGKAQALKNLDLLLEKSNFNPEDWQRKYTSYQEAISQLDLIIAEKCDELEQLQQLKIQEQFLQEFRNNRIDNLRCLLQNILNAPLQAKQRLIYGSISGSIAVRSATDFDIQWKFNLPLLREIISEISPPDPPTGTDGGGINRMNDKYRCSSGDRNRYGSRDRGKTRPHSHRPLRQG